MSMTPAEKQEFLSRRKLIQKKESEANALKKDPKTLILERKQTACKAYLEAKTIGNSPRKKSQLGEV